MQIIYFLIGFSFIVAIIFLAFFIWAVKDGQFDDQVSPAHRILFEDKVTNKNHKHGELNEH